VVESIPRAAPLDVGLIRGNRGILAEIAGEWRSLCDEGPCDEPFLRPEWITAYLDAFAPRARVLLVTARAEGRLRAVLPLIEHRFGIGPLGVTWLHGPTTVHSARFGLVHGRDDADRAVRAITDRLKRWRGWDWLQATLVPDGQALHRIVEAMAAAGFPTATYTQIRTPYLAYPEFGIDLPAFIRRQPPNLRSQLRRALKRLEQEGEVRFTRVGPEAGEAAMLQAVADFAELERQGWKGRAGTAIACDPATRRFYDYIARAAQRDGSALVYRLECGGKPIAIHFGVLSGDGCYFNLKFAYDEAFRSYSPGHLILLHLLVDGAQRGYRSYDLGGNDEDYKRRWTPLARTGANHLVFRSGLRGRAMRHVLLPLALWTKRRLSAGLPFRRGTAQQPDGTRD
jgi:CelD/BcsL family acetyltransferase involved in cellulose biosynthesis